MRMVAFIRLCLRIWRLMGQESNITTMEVLRDARTGMPVLTLLIGVNREAWRISHMAIELYPRKGMGKG